LIGGRFAWKDAAVDDRRGRLPGSVVRVPASEARRDTVVRISAL
jgi:hypothetical protein